MEEVLDYLKKELKDNLVAVIHFGSSVYSKEHEDVDLLIVINKPVSFEFPDDLIRKYKLSPLILTKRDFAINCIEKSPLFVGMVLGDFRVLYGSNFVYRWLPALLNRIKKSDVLYHKYGVRRWR